MNNTLLTLKQVTTILDHNFMPIEPIVTGLRLKKHVETKINIEHVERAMGVKFPDDFVRLIIAFDFGDFNILGVHFGTKTNYLEQLLSIHEQQSYEDAFHLKDQFICIAMGDYFTFIMDVASSAIYVYGSETPFTKKIKIAESFTALIQLLGTAYFHKSRGSQIDFLNIVKQKFDSSSLDFWRELSQ